MSDLTIKLWIPVALTIVTATIGLIVWFIQRHYQRRETERQEAAKRANEKYRQEREESEKRRDEYMVLLVRLLGASISLGEANSKALQNGKCNGETVQALEYARKVKYENREFLERIGVQSIF